MVDYLQNLFFFMFIFLIYVFIDNGDYSNNKDGTSGTPHIHTDEERISIYNHTPVNIDVFDDAPDPDDEETVSIDKNTDQSDIGTAIDIGNILQNPFKKKTDCDNSHCVWDEDLIQFVQTKDLQMKLKHKIPPYLLSYQGSGNTYTRLIIELITQFYTGSSMPKDPFLVNHGFKGGTVSHCDNTTIAIKVHPKWLIDRHGLFMEIWNQKQKERCSGLYSIYQGRQSGDDFSAIFVIRNPWNAFFAEFQRIVMGSKHINGHITNLMRDRLTWRKMKFFKTFLRSNTKNYIDVFWIYEEFKRLNRDVLLIIFENIRNEIWKIIEFLFTEQHLMEDGDIYRKRMNCIVNNDKCNGSPLPRSAYIRRPKVNSSEYVTKAELFGRLDEEILCDLSNKMYPYFVNYSVLQYGYDEYPHCRNTSF